MRVAAVKTAVLCIAAALAVADPASAKVAVANAPRALLSDRAVARVEELGSDHGRDLKKKKGGFLKKIGKAVKKTANDIVDTVSDPFEDAGKEISKVLKKGKVIKRTKSFFKTIKEEGTDAWKDVLQGFDSVDDYVNNQLESDLEWMGKEILEGLEEAWDAICSAPGVQLGMIYTCSYGVMAGVCSATGALLPFCNPSQKLIATIEKALADGVVRLAVRCALYHAIKEMDVCKGRAMGIASTIDDLWVGDPFTPPCELAVYAACGEDLQWSCGFEIDPFCTNGGWKDAFKTLANLLT